MSHWGGDSDNTYTDSDFETDEDLLTDTDWDSELSDLEENAILWDEEESSEDLSPPQYCGEKTPSGGSCTLVSGLCTTGVCTGGMEIRGDRNGRQHGSDRDSVHDKSSSAGHRSNDQDRTKSDL